MTKSDPTKDPEFKRVLGNLLKAPPETSFGNEDRKAQDHDQAETRQEPEMSYCHAWLETIDELLKDRKAPLKLSEDESRVIMGGAVAVACDQRLGCHDDAMHLQSTQNTFPNKTVKQRG
jgi:hypothetical protein